MLWLGLGFAAALIGGLYLFARDLRAPAILLVAIAFGLALLLGRRLEARSDAAWQEAATRLQASFRPAPGVPYLATFGQPAPWDEWARYGQLQCLRAVDGSTADPPFALLHVRYSVRESRGETEGEDWYELAVAVVRLPPGEATGRLVPVNAPGEYVAVHNGASLFLWKKGDRGAGALVAPAELPQLLQQALGVARRLETAPRP